MQARFYIDAFLKEEETRSSMRLFVSENKNSENEGKDTQRFLNLIPNFIKYLHASSYSVILCILVFEEGRSINNLPFMVKYELAKTHKYLLEERGVELSCAIRIVNKEN